MDLSHTVYWSDGSPATSEDYLEHILDTHTFRTNAGGLELRMFTVVRRPPRTRERGISRPAAQGISFLPKTRKSPTQCRVCKGLALLTFRGRVPDCSSISRSPTRSIGPSLGSSPMGRWQALTTERQRRASRVWHTAQKVILSSWSQRRIDN